MAPLLEGRIVSKEGGLSATFEGVEQPYVLCTLERLDDPERHVEARIWGAPEIPEGVGDTVRLERLRAVTDRKAGVVYFDCRRVA